jgi:NADPH:quinone reductase-like Zn-dependent oxidoreductase
VDFAIMLGADLVIDRLTERFEDLAGEVDLVFDLVGGDLQERSWALIRQGGRLVSTVGTPSRDKALARGAEALGFTTRSDASDLREIDALIQSGKVKPFVARRIAFAEAAASLRSLEAQGGRGGKIVVDMSTTIAGVPDHPWQ